MLGLIRAVIFVHQKPTSAYEVAVSHTRTEVTSMPEKAAGRLTIHFTRSLKSQRARFSAVGGKSKVVTDVPSRPAELKAWYSGSDASRSVV